LLADDDEDDRVLLQAALVESEIHNPLDVVEDGEALLAYLRRQPPYDDLRGTPPPGLILLDLNMPRMDGREALRQLQADAALQHIPIVVFTTSTNPEDVLTSYQLGANSYITKPATFDRLAEIVRTLAVYWLRTVQLPGKEDEE
jgi:two-component system response regulator